MGTKRPDVVRSPPMPAQGVTLAEIRANGWTVRATCRTCRISLHTDLGQMIALLGEDFVLWGRHPKCKVWTWGDNERCSGTVLFEVRSIRGGSWVAMRMTGEVQSAVELRSQAASQGR